MHCVKIKLVFLIRSPACFCTSSDETDLRRMLMKAIVTFRIYYCDGRSNHMKTTTPRTDRKIKQLCQKQPFISSSEIKRSMQELISVTTRTIRNRLHKDFKLPARKPLKKPLITPRMAQQRLEFCCHYKDWTKEDWQKVMFSDQSTFLQFASYKPFVRRPHGSSPVDSQYLQPTVKHPPSVMVWGCFSCQGRGGLCFLPKGQTMNASRYISVLDDHLLTFLSIHGCTTFQHDSAPCHKAKSVMNWFHTKNVTMLKWAGNSPDLNPIENLWTLIKKKFLHQIRQLWMSKNRSLKRFGAQILTKMSAKTLQIPCLAAFKR